jgi:hypothetical protein
MDATLGYWLMFRPKDGPKMKRVQPQGMQDSATLASQDLGPNETEPRTEKECEI